MTNTRDENKKQSNNIKDETEKLPDQQKQQLDNITSDVSNIKQINSMKISINIKRQAKKLLRKVSIQQATTNNKPLIHSNQLQRPM